MVTLHWRGFYWKSGTYYQARELARHDREPGVMLQVAALKDGEATLSPAYECAPAFVRSDFTADYVRVKDDGRGDTSNGEQSTLRSLLPPLGDPEWDHAVVFVDKRAEHLRAVAEAKKRAEEFKGTW